MHTAIRKALLAGLLLAGLSSTAHAQATLTKTSLILEEGDSICASTTTLPQVFNGLQRYVTGHYNAGASGSFQVPRFVNKCTSGATTATVAGRIATELAVNPYTDLWIYLGINDAQTSVALATSQANIATIVAAAVAANVHLVWVGPLSWGEKWPSGQNTTVDAFIDGGVPGTYGALDGAIKTAVTGAGGVFADIRRLVYAVQEPLLNTASPGVAVGPLAKPDASGAHPNESGTSYITQVLTPLFTLN